MKVHIHKLVENKFIGYRCTTMDFVNFETVADKGLLTIEDMSGKPIVLDLTPHTIEMLSEFIRYIKSDLDETK